MTTLSADGRPLNKHRTSWRRDLWPLKRARRWRDDQVERFYRRQGFLPIDETEDNDVFICGYPKSGNTWVQNLMASLLFGVEPRYLTDKLVQEVVPDVHQSRFYKRFSDACVFKTHHTRKPRYRQVIHLVRDPRDVAASFFHFDRARGMDVSVAEKTASVITSWRAHTESYLDAGARPAQQMLLRYEDLISQPELEVRRLLEFTRLERPAEIQSRAIEGNKFDNIAARERKFGLANPGWPSGKSFFRKGKVGAYRDTLNEQHVADIESSLSEPMRRLGYEPTTGSRAGD